MIPQWKTCSPLTNSIQQRHLADLEIPSSFTVGRFNLSSVLVSCRWKDTLPELGVSFGPQASENSLSSYVCSSALSCEDLPLFIAGGVLGGFLDWKKYCEQCLEERGRREPQLGPLSQMDAPQVLSLPLGSPRCSLQGEGVAGAHGASCCYSQR